MSYYFQLLFYISYFCREVHQHVWIWVTSLVAAWVTTASSELWHTRSWSTASRGRAGRQLSYSWQQLCQRLTWQRKVWILTEIFNPWLRVICVPVTNLEWSALDYVMKMFACLYVTFRYGMSRQSYSWHVQDGRFDVRAAERRPARTSSPQVGARGRSSPRQTHPCQQRGPQERDDASQTRTRPFVRPRPANNRSGLLHIFSTCFWCSIKPNSVLNCDGQGIKLNGR